MNNIISHLQERLRQRGLRQQINRSKSVTPILDAIAEAAKLEGISADKIVSDYVTGKFEHPVVTASLSPAAEAMKATREAARRSVAPITKPAAAVRPAPRPVAVKPTPAPAAPEKRVQEPAAKMPANLNARQRREWVKAQSTMTAENARTFSDCYLQVAATHRHSPPPEAAIARAELEARGFIFHGKTVSRSFEK